MSQTTSFPPEQLQSVIDTLRSLAGADQDDRVLDDLAAAERRLTETEFRLAVVGEYKRGKSTLINALLGAPVLPMGVLPLTSIITEVRFGEQPTVRVDLVDGGSVAISPAELPNYVTEPGNPENRKRVGRATVFYPGSLLRHGVTIVDTPGIGSIFEHNTATTYGYLEESDAVVVVLAADQPLSAEERKVIRTLFDIENRLLFVVNRVDVLESTDASTSVGFIRDSLAALDGHATDRVFPLSARQALERRMGQNDAPPDFVAFEQALRGSLIEEKLRVLSARSRALARRAADRLALRLRTERQGSLMKRDEIERAIEQFERAADEFDGRLRRSEQVLRYDVEGLYRVGLKRMVDEETARIAAALWPRIEGALDSQLVGSLRHRVAETAAATGEWVVEAARRHYRATEPLVIRGLDAALQGHRQRVNEATADVLEVANRLLGMSVRVHAVGAPLSERAGFHLRDWDYSGGPLRGSTWMLWLPRRWSVPRAHRLLRELLERRISQNLEAIRYDWSLRLDEAVRQFQRSSREQASEIAGAITAALHRSRELRQAGHAASRAAALDRDLEQVLELSRRLSSGAISD